MKILVLGAGRMGFGAAYDLAHSPEVESVTIADLDLELARQTARKVGGSKLTPKRIDVRNHDKVVELMRGHDSAISCVLYHFSLQLAHAAIEAKVNFCDLGGNNRVVASELALDQAARSAGINIIPDCGLAPGMASVLVAHGAARFDQLEAIRIRVGGLPQNPKPPLNYQIVFAVEGLINEYVEPSRVMRGGKVFEVESLTEVESLEFPSVGTLEAFHTSGGVSTLPESLAGKVRDLDYKTIRYPGHCERFKLLVDLGLCSSEEVELNGKRVTPRAMTGELLRRHLPADEPDLVLIRIEFDGATQGARRRLVYDVIERFDETTGLSAMMRTTSIPISIIAQMMARGETTEKGALPQERCVPADLFIEALADRGIRIIERFVE